VRQQDVRELLKQQPFQPLRLHLTNGTVFDIRHPDMAIVGRSALRLSMPPDPLEERHAVISLLHIMWIEFTSPSE
jgi:hypothetical protein